jgi:hypothetical protein
MSLNGEGVGSVNEPVMKGGKGPNVVVVWCDVARKALVGGVVSATYPYATHL